MKNVLLFTFLIIYSGVFSQNFTVTGIVVNTSNQPVKGAIVLGIRGNSITDSTNASGRFSFTAKEGDRFAIEKEGYELEWRTARKNTESYIVILDVKVQEIESIVITRSNSEEALDIQNVNIIHYQPLDGAILTLKKRKRFYMLGLDSLRSEGPSYILEIDKPKELFFDCLKNAYILSADSAYQFVITDSSLAMLTAIPMSLFDKYIRPCVSQFDDRLVFESFKRLNKEYSLTIHSTMPTKTIFQKFDVLGYQGAYEASLMVGKMVDPMDGDTLVDPIYLATKQRRDVYGRHDTEAAFERALSKQKATVMKEQDKVNSGVDDDKRLPVMSGPRTSAWTQSNGKSFSKAMANYILLTQPIKVKTFQLRDFAIVIDYDSNSVDVLDHFGFHIKESSFVVSGKVKNVLQDRATGELYLYVRDGKNNKVYGIDPFTGQTSYLKNFGGMPNTEQAIIYDRYLYYKVLERDFYGINRVKLPNSYFYAEKE